MVINIGIEDVGAAVLQEFWNQVAFQAIDLASETRDVVLEKNSFQEFSRAISQLSILLQGLDAGNIEAKMGSEFTKEALKSLNSQLREAQKIIKDYKSGSRIRLLLHSHSLLLQLQKLTKEIASTISSFQLLNLDTAVDLKTMTEQTINNLSSVEFRSAATTEKIASEIENLLSQNSQNRENAVKLLEKIAEAVGAGANVSLVKNELALLKREKEEMEDQKKQAEALQLSQLIQLLYSTEIVTRPQNENMATYHQQYSINSFICPLSNEIMTDPAALFCGHSFERKAIQEQLNRGKKKCPVCGEEPQSLELTANLNLRSSIEEWKQRDMELKLQVAISGINSNDHSRQNNALEDMQLIMEMPQYAEKVAEKGLIPKLVELFKDNRLNTKAILKCLCFLAKLSDDNKEAIVEAGVVRRIIKQMYKGKKDPDALEVLLELSRSEVLREQIGNTKECIPLLVSLLSNDNPDVLHKAENILHFLSSNTTFTVKMAETGHFQPFVARFNQGPPESRAMMAADLTKMQLKENNIKDLKDTQFVHSLIQMLSSNSPAYKLACLGCIKKLIAYHETVELFLSDPTTIPLLLNVISFVGSDKRLKEEAGEILALLVGACEHLQFQMHQGLQELQSKHNVSLFLGLVSSSDPETKIQFLHLLIELSCKSEAARSSIRSDKDAVSHLFSSVDGGEHIVRKWAMKLLQSISDFHPDGVPLPPSPRKETSIYTLVDILTHSPNAEERSTAAAIISQLPKDDIIIDEILWKTGALKAIHEVICSTDEENDGIRTPCNIDTCHTSLLENALAALLRFTEPTKPELQRQVGELELYPSLVRVLSRGSSLAKKRTAMALAQLSESTNLSMSDTTIMIRQARNSISPFRLLNDFPSMSWCCSTSSGNENLCVVHGAACSPKHTFCLVKADAVKPLVRTLSETESDVAEAALTALETLLTDHSTLSLATAAIVDNEGLVAILQVLEKGNLSAKNKALELLHKILKHTHMSGPLFQRTERILIQQLLHEDALKKKVALVLRQMNIIPEQSSYF